MVGGSVEPLEALQSKATINARTYLRRSADWNVVEGRGVSKGKHVTEAWKESYRTSSVLTVTYATQ